MSLHGAANGSARTFRCEQAARRLLAATAALALTAGCAGAIPPARQRAAEQAAARAAAESAVREASGFLGVYAARVPAGLGPARAVTLLLRGDGVAVLDSVRLGRGVERQIGRWSSAGEELRVEWVSGPDGLAPASMAWLRAEGRLVPSEWDPGAWGEGGLGLARWEASRAPRSGCYWQPFADATLGVRLLVEGCSEGGHRFSARGAEIVDVSDATAGARGTPVVQVFGKKPEQPLPDAIRRRFFPQLVPRVRAGCVVRRGGGVEHAEPAKEVWTIGATAKYREETAKWRAAEPGAMVCGPYGERDGVGYFEYHPKASPSRYLFVWLGREAPRFDERSIELLD
jgi:hypothetical protein